MKKSIFTLLLLVFVTAFRVTQIGGIENSLNDVFDIIFPIILGVIFLIEFLFNTCHFFGENADTFLEKSIYEYFKRI